MFIFDVFDFLVFVVRYSFLVFDVRFAVFHLRFSVFSVRFSVFGVDLRLFFHRFRFLAVRSCSVSVLGSEFSGSFFSDLVFDFGWWFSFFVLHFRFQFSVSGSVSFFPRGFGFGSGSTISVFYAMNVKF